MRRLLALVILMVSAAPASAFHWPWEHHHRIHHSRYAITKYVARPRPLPDCPRILEAIRHMPPGDYVLARQASSRVQIEIIDRCIKASLP